MYVCVYMLYMYIYMLYICYLYIYKTVQPVPSEARFHWPASCLASVPGGKVHGVATFASPLRTVEGQHRARWGQRARRRYSWTLSLQHWSYRNVSAWELDAPTLNPIVFLLNGPMSPRIKQDPKLLEELHESKCTISQRIAYFQQTWKIRS